MTRPSDVKWRDVVGYEGLYMVSNTGDVLSLERFVPTKTGGVFHVRQRMLKISHTRGRAKVRLYKDGASPTEPVHRLVAFAFLGERPEGGVVRHLDDRPTNNSISNLAYGTYSDNSQDAIRNGKVKRGLESSSSKITEHDMVRILDGKETAKQVAAAIGISSGRVHQIRSGHIGKNNRVERKMFYGRRGSENGASKLTEESVIAILASDKSLRELSAQYGVGKVTIWHIQNGKTWKHIPRPQMERLNPPC